MASQKWMLLNARRVGDVALVVDRIERVRIVVVQQRLALQIDGLLVQATARMWGD